MRPAYGSRNFLSMWSKYLPLFGRPSCAARCLAKAPGRRRAAQTGCPVSNGWRREAGAYLDNHAHIAGGVADRRVRQINASATSAQNATFIFVATSAPRRGTPRAGWDDFRRSECDQRHPAPGPPRGVWPNPGRRPTRAMGEMPLVNLATWPCSQRSMSLLNSAIAGTTRSAARRSVGCDSPPVAAGSPLVPLVGVTTIRSAFGPFSVAANGFSRINQAEFVARLIEIKADWTDAPTIDLTEAEASPR